MPSAVFPRLAEQEGVIVGLPEFRQGGFRNVSQSGAYGLRNTTSKGVSWTEVYPPLKSTDANSEQFISWINWAFNNNIKFTITNPLARGSGRAPLGSGTGGVTVVGVNSGDTVNVSGGTYQPGDWVRIAGYGFAMQITDTNTAIMKVNPPIVKPTVGGEAVTTTGVTFNCIIHELTMARIDANDLPFHYTQLTITFAEVPNN